MTNASVLWPNFHSNLLALLVITLRIQDNGVGFDPVHFKLGSGLQNMRQRVEQLKGTIEMVSALHQGTTLRITLPIS